MKTSVYVYNKRQLFNNNYIVNSTSYENTWSHVCSISLVCMFSSHPWCLSISSIPNTNREHPIINCWIFDNQWIASMVWSRIQENKRMDQALTLISVKTTIRIGGRFGFGNLPTFQLPFLIVLLFLWLFGIGTND